MPADSRVHDVVAWWTDAYQQTRRIKYFWTKKDFGSIKAFLRHGDAVAGPERCLEALRSAMTRYLAQRDGFHVRRGLPFADLAQNPNPWMATTQPAARPVPKRPAPEVRQAAPMTPEDMRRKILEEEAHTPGMLARRYLAFRTLEATHPIARVIYSVARERLPEETIKELDRRVALRLAEERENKNATAKEKALRSGGFGLNQMTRENECRSLKPNAS